jgi:hypothetical protein
MARLASLYYHLKSMAGRCPVHLSYQSVTRVTTCTGDGERPGGAMQPAWLHRIRSAALDSLSFHSRSVQPRLPARKRQQSNTARFESCSLVSSRSSSCSRDTARVLSERLRGAAEEKVYARTRPPLLMLPCCGLQLCRQGSSVERVFCVQDTLFFLEGK